MNDQEKGVGQMRKIIAYLATSADGFIARPDGGVEWLDRPRSAGDYGMAKFYRSVDTVLMGRKTWAVARKLGQSYYPGKVNYVFSRSRRRSSDPEVTFVTGSLVKFANQLRSSRGKHIWLVGGAGLFGAFLDAGQLDELIVHVVPTLIGSGIPLLSPRRRHVPLRLVSCKRFADGMVRLHYAVTPTTPRRGRRIRRRQVKG